MADSEMDDVEMAMLEAYNPECGNFDEAIIPPYSENQNDAAEIELDGPSPSTSTFSANPTQPTPLSTSREPVTLKGTAPSKNSILVNPRQRGNPILKFVRSVPWEYSEIVPDYVMGASTCALFLSVRYHNLHPDYIHERLKELRQAYALRVLLVQVDVSDPFPILKTLTHISMLAGLTLLPAYSAEEAGKILENYKIYENKPVDFIQEKQDPSILQQVMDALTSIRSVNKTDATTLITVFGSLAEIVKASPEKLALCPGFGPQKAQRVHAALHAKFKSEPK